MKTTRIERNQDRVWVWLAALAAISCCGAIGQPNQAASPAAATKQKTEQITTIQPGVGGAVHVISQEISSTEADGTKESAPRVVATDETPRKARVAVVPAVYVRDVRSQMARELKEKWGLPDATAMESPGYTRHLVDALFNTRKLDVMERENLNPAVKEIDFGESDYADPAKVVKIGQMLNADYVVIPEIRYMGFLAEERDVPFIPSGAQQLRYRGKIATNLRTVDVKTSRVVSSSIDELCITNRIRRDPQPLSSPIRDFINRLYAESAAMEAAKIVDVAYPIRIVSVADDLVFLNRGKGAMRLGEVLDVYRPGEMMVDPDTKESLGFHEDHVGQVQVVEVNEKTCKAKVTVATSPVLKLYLCRRNPKASTHLEKSQPTPKLD